MFDISAHRILTDDQIKTWQLQIQQRASQRRYVFPNYFTRSCIIHFDTPTYREMRSFVEHAITRIQRSPNHANKDLIQWQRRLRVLCKSQPFGVSLWRQLVYDVEFDDLSASVGFYFINQRKQPAKAST